MSATAGTMDLNAARKSLTEALGDEMKLYLSFLKSWFKQKMSKEDFDHEARKMLSEDAVPLHNQFLLALFIKCQTLATSSSSREQNSATHSTSSISSKSSNKKSRPKKRPHPTSSSTNRTNFQQRFVPANPLLQAPIIHVPSPDPDEKGMGIMSREMVLPDVGLIHGRMIVAAWDYGLEGVEDNTVQLLLEAVEHQLKTLITITLARRVGYKLREKHFRFHMGGPLPQSQLRNLSLIQDDQQESEATAVCSKGHIPTLRPSVETGSRDAAVQLSCTTEMPPAKPSISLFDLYDAIQVHKSALPSHTVYATNLECILGHLWHPGRDEAPQPVTAQFGT